MKKAMGKVWLIVLIAGILLGNLTSCAEEKSTEDEMLETTVISTQMVTTVEQSETRTETQMESVEITSLETQALCCAKTVFMKMRPRRTANSHFDRRQHYDLHKSTRGAGG